MTYKIKNTNVQGNGYSYNLNTKHDAQKLCKTLNTYENTIRTYKNIEKQYDALYKTIIQLRGSIKIIETELNTLHEIIK